MTIIELVTGIGPQCHSTSALRGMPCSACTADCSTAWTVASANMAFDPVFRSKIEQVTDGLKATRTANLPAVYSGVNAKIVKNFTKSRMAFAANVLGHESYFW